MLVLIEHFIANLAPLTIKDNVDGGDITFNFVETALFVASMGFLDIDNRASVTVYHVMNDGMEAETRYNLPQLGDNSYQELEINIDFVTKIVVQFARSGAVTFIDFCPAPTTSPTTSPTPAVPTEAPPTAVTPTSPGVCINYTIAFDTYPNGTTIPPGTYVQNEWFDAYGIILAAAGGFDDRPRIFDTTNPVKDPDLGAPNDKCTPPGPGKGLGGVPGTPGENCEPLGNVIIIQEDNDDPSIPDDEQRGGQITFFFTRGVDYISECGLMDIEGNDTEIFVDHEGQTTTIPIIGTGNNGVQTIEIGLSSVTKLVVDFHTSGAVTFITFCL